MKMSVHHRGGVVEEYDISAAHDDPVYVWCSAFVGLIVNLCTILTFTAYQPTFSSRFLFWWLRMKGVKPNLYIGETK